MKNQYKRDEMVEKQDKRTVSWRQCSNLRKKKYNGYNNVTKYHDSLQEN